MRTMEPKAFGFELVACGLKLAASGSKLPVRVGSVAAMPVRGLPFLECVVLYGIFVEGDADPGRGREREFSAVEHRHLREEIGRVGLGEAVLILQIGEVGSSDRPVN